MADDHIHAFILPISVEKQLEAINMKKLIVSTFILLLTIGAGEISAQSFLERLGKATQKTKSTIAKLNKTKMYTQEQADSYYPLSNPRTLHIDNDFVAREKLKHSGNQKQQRAQNLNVNKLPQFCPHCRAAGAPPEPRSPFLGLFACCPLSPARPSGGTSPLKTPDPHLWARLLSTGSLHQFHHSPSQWAFVGPSLGLCLRPHTLPPCRGILDQSPGCLRLPIFTLGSIFVPRPMVWSFCSPRPPWHSPSQHPPTPRLGL